MTDLHKIINESLINAGVEKLVAGAAVSAYTVVSMINENEVKDYVYKNLGIELGAELVKRLDIKESFVSGDPKYGIDSVYRYEANCIPFKNYQQIENFAISLISNYLSAVGGEINGKES